MGGGGTVKNVVLFVGSGLGPAGVTLARGFQEALRKGDASVPATLAFEPYLTATLRTRSSDK
jgi:alkaline phosphatase